MWDNENYILVPWQYVRALSPIITYIDAFLMGRQGNSEGEMMRGGMDVKKKIGGSEKLNLCAHLLKGCGMKNKLKLN